MIAWVSGSAALMHRMNFADSAMLGRTTLYELVRDAILKNPWLGYGSGAFEEGFRLFYPESLRAVYDKAHNTYLETAFERGVIAAGCSVLLMLALAFHLLRGVVKRRYRWWYPAIGFSALMLVGFHSLFDFSVQIPAIAITFSAIIGMAAAQSGPARDCVAAR